jgi:nucleotide-binding universal stress UspA family protein
VRAGSRDAARTTPGSERWLIVSGRWLDRRREEEGETMIGTVIVPLDGSKLAAQVLPYARAIAEKSDVPLQLVWVVPEDGPASAKEEAQTYLRQQADAIGSRARINIRMGHPGEQIVKAADEATSPLIVMATHGRSGLSRIFSGSVAEHVVSKSGAPVFLIRHETKDRQDNLVHIVAVSLDGSVYAEAALPYAKELARDFDAELLLVRVAETFQVYSMMSPDPVGGASAEAINEVTEQLISETRDYLEATATTLRAEGFNVKTAALEGFPADQLMALEREMAVNVIVMATHGRSGLGRLVFGSVADRILKNGTTPILMIKPSGEIDDEKKG